MLHDRNIGGRPSRAVSVRLASDMSAALPMADLPWSEPPHPGDDRLFGPTLPVPVLPRALRPTERAVLAALAAAGRLGLKGATEATRLPFRDLLATLRALVALGAARDVSEGAAARSLAWRDLCLRVLEAYPRAGGGKAKHVVGLVPGLRHAEVKAALEHLGARGLLHIASEAVVVRHLGQADASQPVATGSAVPGEGASVRRPEPSAARAPATRKPGRTAGPKSAAGAPASPVGAWTRRRHRSLADCLGADAARFPLPETDREARVTVAEMQREVAARDPDALTRATFRQRQLVETILAELAGTEGLVPPYDGVELSREAANAFITRWFSARPATARQLACATTISRSLGIPMPEATTHVEVGKYISTHIEASKASLTVRKAA